MSLKAFHIVFIVCSSLLATGGGFWAWRHSATHDPEGYRLVAVACFAGGIGLLVYGAWFLRKLKGVRYL
ncbi:MAG: hypothetical protein HYT87_14275 [Nitrospirae bacterium]|nr:hypothetical protein [Nitrospirota bacterium]